MGSSAEAEDYVVKQGDCVSSIAKSRGHFWQTIWFDEANATLRRLRGSPNVLLPGDRLTIPALREKREAIATKQRHRFRLRGEPSELKLRILEHGEPVANTDWQLKVDGQFFSGTTDEDGQLTVTIPGNASKGELRIGESAFDLELGCMDPLSEVSGIQRRLANLHFHCEITGQLDAQTIDALNRFREAAGLKPSDQLDDATRDALDQWHDSMEALPEDDVDEDPADLDDEDDDADLTPSAEEPRDEDLAELDAHAISR